MSNAEILWVNHASYILSYGSTSIITDPWLFGSAFNNGWDLISPTQFEIDDFQNVTHIWFSHEHPDHFAPRVLKSIGPEIREQITVLFQETHDKKVIGFCRNLGFKVRELPDLGWATIADDFRVKCGKEPFYDSWLMAEVGGTSILNVNDCTLDSKKNIRNIFDQVGQVDLLLTQFGYANWIGGANDTDLRVASAKEKLDRVQMQVESLQPKYTIPFASFVYFSHKENFYLNDAVNTIDVVETFISQHTQSAPVVLYPGDRWVVGSQHDNDQSIEKYMADFRKITQPKRESIPVSLERLTSLSEQYVKRIKTENNALLVWFLSRRLFPVFGTVRIFLTDLDILVEINVVDGMKVVRKGRERAHMETDAENLAYIFEHRWGIDTLVASGRLNSTESNFRKVARALSLGALNNTGRAFGFKVIFDRFLLRKAIQTFFFKPSFLS